MKTLSTLLTICAGHALEIILCTRVEMSFRSDKMSAILKNAFYWSELFAFWLILQGSLFREFQVTINKRSGKAVAYNRVGDKPLLKTMMT